MRKTSLAQVEIHHNCRPVAVIRDQLRYLVFIPTHSVQHGSKQGRRPRQIAATRRDVQKLEGFRRLDEIARHGRYFVADF